MLFVVEASVAACWCFPDETSAAADTAIDGLLHDEAIAPGLWTLEITNILIVHQGRGSVFTGYAWTGRLLGAGVRLSYALGGPKDNPEMESFFGRFKVENRSFLLGAES